MEDVTVQLDWSAADAVPVLPANLVLVQTVGAEVILSFGHAPPPIAMASIANEQLGEYLREHRVPVQHVARFTLPVPIATVLMKFLKAHLPDEADAEQGATP